MFSKFDNCAQKILIMAKKEMSDLKHPYVGTEHLLLAILKNKSLEITKILNSYKITYDAFKAEIIKVIGIGKESNEWYLFTPLLKRVIENTILYHKNGTDKITTYDLFLSLLEEGDGVANRLLMGMNVDIEYLYETFSKKFKFNSLENRKSLFLEEFAINLNKVCLEGDYEEVVGRDKEINRIIEILLRKNKNNPLLIGDAGVGKTAVVEELSRRIAMGMVPEKLLNKNIYSVSIASLIAGTKYRGEFEERINKIIEEIENNDDVILFVDEVHTLVGAGGAEGAIDASNLIKPYLARGKLKIIGATTQKEYATFIENDKALDRRFQKVYIKEPNLDETKDILLHLRPIYEKYHRVIISEKMIDKILFYTNKYVSNGRQPDKTIDVLDEVCSKTALKDTKLDKKIKELNVNLSKLKTDKNKAIINHNYKLAINLKDKEKELESEFNKLLITNSQNKSRKVTLNVLFDVLAEKTNIPIKKINELNYDKILLKMKTKVIGQDRNIEKIIKTLENTSFNIKKRSVSILLVGKSGVGKTFLVKELAKVLYNEDNFLRLDMSEFKESHSISKIIGAPPGYVGYNNKETILEKIKFHPYAILLLDEIEKASSDVLKLFLQVFDEGFITNASGEKIDFSHVTIFMTSNLGMDSNNIGFTETNDVLMEKIRNFLGVELLNRIDCVIRFDNLKESDINKIIINGIKEVVERKDLNKILSTNIVDKILSECNYQQFGARKIEMLIYKYVNQLKQEIS